MGSLISFPILGLVTMLQVAIFSNIHILYGTTDLVLLSIIAWTLQEKTHNGLLWAVMGGCLVSWISSVPLWPYLTGYVLVALFVQFIKRRIWQIPILAMYFSTALGAIFVQFVSLGILIFAGAQLEWIESINLVILPSVLLNLILALPVYLILTDIARWVYPAEPET